MSTAAHHASPSQPELYRFGAALPKIAYLAFGLAVTWFGGWFLWEPLSAVWRGEIVQARVAEIRVVEPGRPDRVFRYRREYPPESNLAVTFQHYVTIMIDGHPVLHRISVDSRKTPISTYAVNDMLSVAFRRDDPRRLAFVVGDARTWGLGGLFAAIGLTIVASAVPMLFATRRPVVVDPEACDRAPVA